MCRLAIFGIFQEMAKFYPISQECVFENKNVKLEILTKIDETLEKNDEKTIIASSTSAILPSHLSENMHHRLVLTKCQFCQTAKYCQGAISGLTPNNATNLCAIGGIGTSSMD